MFEHAGKSAKMIHIWIWWLAFHITYPDIWKSKIEWAPPPEEYKERK